MLAPSIDRSLRRSGRALALGLLWWCLSSLAVAASDSQTDSETDNANAADQSTPVVAQLAPGEKLFYICAGCHTLRPEDGNSVGPHLGDVLGRAFAGVEGYGYSEAMIERGRDGLTWDTETLDQYLRNPQAFVIGTTMSFQGIPDRNDRATLIRWLADASATDTFRYQEDVAVFDNQRIVGILNIEADPDYGEYLGGECVACHQRSEQSGGVPRIHGLTAAYFIDAMLQYKDGTRKNPVMQTIASSMGDADLASLARYFEQEH